MELSIIRVARSWTLTPRTEVRILYAQKVNLKKFNKKKLPSSSARTSAFHVENIGWIPIESKKKPKLRESNLVAKYEASNFKSGVRFSPFLRAIFFFKDLQQTKSI